MATQRIFQTTSRLNEAEVRGRLSKLSPHCIARHLPKETVLSVLNKISKNTTPPNHELSVYSSSVDWIGSLSTSISNELSKTFNAPADKFTEPSRDIANVVSSIGNGTWSSGISPVNAVKDLETNLPLYISDYFDHLAGWSREYVYEESKDKIGCDMSRLPKTKDPHPAKSPNGPETALSGVYVKLSWNLPNINVNCPLKTDSNTPSFSSKGEPSSGEVYRYFAFVDHYKQAIVMKEDGSINRELYDFTDSAQLWRIESYGNFYALYNKKHKKYLGRKLIGTYDKPDNNWHDNAIYMIEDINTSTYSVGYTSDNTNIEYCLKDLILVTVPLVAWRNSSGQFMSVDDAHNETLGMSVDHARNEALGFADGEPHNNTTVPKPEQLFLFVPHPDFKNKAVVVGHNGKFLEFNPLSQNKVSCHSNDLKSPTRLPFIMFDYEQNIWPL